MSKLFVGGISQETTEVDLFAYFKSFGAISSVRIAFDKRLSSRRSPDCSKGYAFIQTKTEAVYRRITDHKRHLIKGRIVDINRAIEQNELPPQDVVLKKHRKLYFRGVRSSTTEAELHAYFSAIGRVVKVYLIFSPQTGRSRSFGYVEFETLAAALAATTQKSHKLAGKKFSVERLRDVQDSEQPCQQREAVDCGEPRRAQALGSPLGNPKELQASDFDPLLPATIAPQDVHTAKKLDDGCVEDILSHSLTYLTINHSSRTTIAKPCRGAPLKAPAVSRKFAQYYQHIKSLNATVQHSDTTNYRLNKESVAAHRARRANKGPSYRPSPGRDDHPRLSHYYSTASVHHLALYTNTT